jgi:hypothetical protein
MNAKQKAEELCYKYYDVIYPNIKEDLAIKLSKKCALICCNEVLGYMGADRGYEFWSEVRQEILKLK